MLQFEDRLWKRTSDRAAAIRRRFKVDPVTYARRLDALIDRPEAMATAPLVVRRLHARRRH